VGVAIRLASAALRGIGGGFRAGSDPGLPDRGVLWVGRAIRPDPGALRRGGDPRDAECPEPDLLTRSFFLDATEDPVARSSACSSRRVGAASVRMPIRTWAIEQAIRHEAFAAIVADARGMTVAESRRLQVAASDRNLPMLVLLLREPREAGARSVAGFRWRVESCAIDPREDGGAPFEPSGAWRVRLMRGRASLPPEVRRTIESDAGLTVRIGACVSDRRSRWPSGREPERIPPRDLASPREREACLPIPWRHMPSAWSERSCAG